MDYGRSFSYALDDNDWPVKVGIGTLLNIIPILGYVFTTGYMVQITRNVMHQGSEALPEWGDDFGKKFTDGLIVTIASFIYSLPFLVLLCVSLGVWVLPAFGAGAEDEELVGALAGVSFAAMCAVGCLAMLYLLALSLVLPAIVIFYAREGTFGACFKIGDIVGYISRNLNIYLAAMLLLFVGGFVLMFVMGIVQIPLSIIPLCGNVIGWLLGLALGFYLQLVAGHLFGQVGREATYA